MTDIVERLRGWFRDVNAVSAIDLMDEAADEIERLRNGAVAGCETVCPHVRGTVTQHCSLNFTLTEAEHDALEFAVETGRVAIHDDAILRKLLERLTHDAVPAARAESDEVRTDKAVTSHRRDGTGDTPSEAEIDALEYVVEEGRTASIDDYGILRSWLIRLRPEWEGQSYEESNEKRANTTTNRDTTPGEGSVQADCTLTDEEREAVEAADAYMSAAGCRNTNVQATLRGLLERFA